MSYLSARKGWLNEAVALVLKLRVMNIVRGHVCPLNGHQRSDSEAKQDPTISVMLVTALVADDGENQSGVSVFSLRYLQLAPVLLCLP